MNAIRGVCVLAVALAGISLWLFPAAAQERDPALGFRRLIADLTAPAMDRGIRDRDPVREAWTSRTEVVDRSGSGGTYARGSMIVKFRQGTSPAAQRTLLALVDGSETPDLPYTDFDIVTIGTDTDPEDAARRLSAQPDVEYAQARYRVQPRFRPNDQFYPLQWNLPMLEMERAWDINPGAASSIVVAVLDSGAAYRSGMFRFTTVPFEVDGESFPSIGTIDVPFAAAPELGGPDRFVSPFDFIWGDNNPLDFDGHGTHVAGIVGQLTNNGVGVAGMAFNVRLMPVKVVDSIWDEAFNSPFVGTDDTVARGVRYAADNGAKVINMSIGRFEGPASPVVQSAITYAVSRGAFVAVAAGNDFFGDVRGRNRPERFGEFAPQIDGMVAVGAVGRTRARAGYSTTGAYVELAAPGGDAGNGILQQTFDFDLVETFTLGPARFRAPRFDAFSYSYFQGTSMAAPHVSGFAALLMEQGITSPAAVEAIMKQTATDLGPAGRDDEYGHGLINPRAALRGMGLAK